MGLYEAGGRGPRLELAGREQPNTGTRLTKFIPMT